MGHTQTGVFEEEAEETVNDLIQHHEVPQDLADEAERLCERGDPITALDVLVRNRQPTEPDQEGAAGTRRRHHR